MIDTHSYEARPVKVFTTDECPDSTHKSDDTISDYEYYRKGTDVGTTYISPQQSLGPGSFETISKLIFEELRTLKLNPRGYANNEPDESLWSEIESFDRDNVEWSDALSAIGRHHANYDGPCHYNIDTDQINESKMFSSYMTWEGDAQIVQWEGDFNPDPRVILRDMLRRKVFDYVFKDDMISHVGVACSCNPYVGMLCDVVGAKNPKPKREMPFEEWLPLVQGQKCSAYCRDIDLFWDE